MWQLSNLQIDSSVIQIVQSDVLRNSVDTTAAITNSAELNVGHMDGFAMYSPEDQAPDGEIGSRWHERPLPARCNAEL